MKFALVNPRWRFDGSIYFGCHDRHLPLEFGYAKALLEAGGHEAALVDAHAEDLTLGALAARLEHLAPDVTVLTTAPTYLFWRCPPAELRMPQRTAAAIRERAGKLVLVGPHASTTPETTLKKIGADAAVLGECEQVLALMADAPWETIEGLALNRDGRIRVNGGPQAADMTALPALRWPDSLLHEHHHHRFDGGNRGLGAELEVSRGCPYACTFCAKDNYRDRYRKRPLAVVFDELDRLIAQGVGYVYLIDEILLPDDDLLDGLAARPVQFGIQTRIDLWKPEQLDRLGAAGCVSIEAGVEAISEAGRRVLNKRCKLDNDELTARLARAKQTVPFVQASLIDSGVDDPDAVERWRQELLDAGVWANKPVPMFPYPGSPSYVHLFGMPDEHAWERAVDHYRHTYERFSDIQEAKPRPLWWLEQQPAG